MLFPSDLTYFTPCCGSKAIRAFADVQNNTFTWNYADKYVLTSWLNAYICEKKKLKRPFFELKECNMCFECVDVSNAKSK